MKEVRASHAWGKRLRPWNALQIHTRGHREGGDLRQGVGVVVWEVTSHRGLHDFLPFLGFLLL